MSKATTSRRRFLAAAIAFTGASMTSESLRLATAFAQSTGQPNGAAIRMARLLIPHDAIGDDVYRSTLENAIAATASSYATLLDDTLARLDAGRPQGFMALDPADQLTALRAIESEDFFKAMLFNLKLFFYGNPGSWAVMSYEGPSWQKGGYLNRGAGEIDWLPEGE